ncbi:mitochondrial splicing system protein [Savitreella phatthalungensis]
MTSTIYALSTVPGKAAVAVVRISGPLSFSILSQLTKSPGRSHVKPNHPSSQPLSIPPREARIRSLHHPHSHLLLDRALVLAFPGPRSFTGEDTVELHLHGSTAVTSAVLRAIPDCQPPTSSPANLIRLALPGEFSKRAFLNGKLKDLTAAESLRDVIDAQTEQQRIVAFRGTDGSLGLLYDSWRLELVTARAQLEAVIDFGDDGGDAVHEEEGAYEVCDRVVTSLQARIRHHLSRGRAGELLKTGIKLAIFGPPNAGKSSLLNALARTDASIVSAEPGTTRDIVSRIVDIGGFPVTVSDTAGLRDVDKVGVVEGEGIRRALTNIDGAHVRVCLLPADSPDPDSLTAGCLATHPDTLVVYNKVDLVDRVGDGLGISCRTLEGVDRLVESLVKRFRHMVHEGKADEESDVVVMSERHREGLQACLRHLDQYSEGDRDLVFDAEHLRSAADAFGRITGKVDIEHVLGRIFSSFCIGK